MSTKASTQVRVVVVALFVALIAFAVFYNAFLRIFIKYWEWQHDGRSMKFTVWPGNPTPWLIRNQISVLWLQINACLAACPLRSSPYLFPF